MRDDCPPHVGALTEFDPRADEDALAKAETYPLWIPRAIADPEWFYREGDAKGFPTRADV